MQRISIAAALAVFALAAWCAPARADQTLVFNIVGAGHITGAGLDCSRAPGGPLLGDCSERAFDGPDQCNEQFCFPSPGGLAFQANDSDGFQFTNWSHPQCVNPRRACSVLVAIGPQNPDLTVTATFVDAQAPTVALTSPADGAVVRDVLPLTAAATDNAGVSQLVFRVGGNPFQTFETAPFATSVDTHTLRDGPLAVSATVNDAVGLSSAATANVTVDNTNPTLAVTGPDGQTFNAAGTPTWTIAAADTATAVTVRCSVVLVGQPQTFGACTSNTQERLANQPDGRYSLTVRATDAANHAVEQTRAFAIDTTAPETTIASGPDDGSTTTQTALTWGFRANEPATFECRLYLTAIGPGPFGPCSAAAAHSVAALAPGGYAFEVRATDAVGNVDATAARRTVVVTIPSPPPPPPPVVTVTLAFGFHGAGRHTTKLTSLVVKSVPVGATVTAVCPKGCAKKRLALRNASGNVSLKALTRAKRLAVATKITVTVSKPGAVSAVKVLTIRKAKAPTVASLCLPPGASKPRACA
jgi:hypothetical protein